jgi:pimeloyl-ACP methyl ester carboxylesterase
LIQHPALVVTGDDVPLVPRVNSLLLAHRLPNARAVVAPGEGHLLLMDPDSTVLGPIRRPLQRNPHTSLIKRLT